MEGLSLGRVAGGVWAGGRRSLKRGGGAGQGAAKLLVRGTGLPAAR